MLAANTPLIEQANKITIKLERRSIVIKTEKDIDSCPYELEEVNMDSDHQPECDKHADVARADECANHADVARSDWQTEKRILVEEIVSLEKRNHNRCFDLAQTKSKTDALTIQHANEIKAIADKISALETDKKLADRRVNEMSDRYRHSVAQMAVNPILQVKVNTKEDRELHTARKVLNHRIVRTSMERLLPVWWNKWVNSQIRTARNFSEMCAIRATIPVVLKTIVNEDKRHMGGFAKKNWPENAME